jgi:hypothetical protein
MIVSCWETQDNTKNSFYIRVLERSIKLSTIYLSVEKNFETNKTLFRKINLVNINKLVINGSVFNPNKDMDFIDIINSCKRVTCLDILYHVTDNFVFKMTRLSQLQFFKIHSQNIQFTPKIVQFLAEQCRNLTNVDLYFRSDYSCLYEDQFQTEFKNKDLFLKTKQIYNEL